VAQWQAFRRKWRPILKKKKYRVPIEKMRRSDLENFQGAFVGWNKARRNAFLSELHPVIRQHTRVAIAHAVIKKDWEEVIPHDLKKLFGGPYGWCAHSCVVGVRAWCLLPEIRYERPLSWFFESGTHGTGDVMQMFAAVAKDPTLREAYHVANIKDLVFTDKKVMPLHAADLVAYEIFKQVENQIVDRGLRPIRFSMRDILRSGDLPHLQYWNKPRLREWVNNWLIRQYPLTAIKIA
jgi:hypothetical protein